jgi:glycogen(starch) synthase
MISANADTLYEVSWEICNKVGGIYTVVQSKAALMCSYYPDYFLIGPYFEDKSRVDFEEKKPNPSLSRVFQKLSEIGIVCKYGKWNIPSEPNTILVDFKGMLNKKNDIKKKLWEDYKIDSLYSAWDFDEPVVWATAVGILLNELEKESSGKKIVAQFHEWLAGAALLYLKNKKSGIATVFTTHATMLGRAIAGSGADLYRMMASINPERSAYDYKVQDKFLVERACAQNSDVFTTVSEITGLEAEKILGRKPEVLLLNGLDIDKFPTVEEFSLKHVICKEKIKEYLIFHFFPYYSFDVSNTLIFFIVGRYEFKNKGIDIFIEALGRLNQKLKDDGSKQSIAAIFWIPQETHGMKTELLENKNYYRHIKNYVGFNAENILNNIIYDLVSGKDLSKDSLFAKDFLLDLKKDILHFKRKGMPPLVTHNINDEGNDLILQSFVNKGLDNNEKNPVKVILYPVYLDGDDGLINLQYYDGMAGCHLGVFPSYYEPWGYTPLEAASLGVPSITSDLSGFGMFIKEKIKNDMDDGIFVLRRFGRDDSDVVKDFTELLYRFSKRGKKERAKNKLNAKELSSLADWGILVENYIKAHNLAIEKVKLNGA